MAVVVPVSASSYGNLCVPRIYLDEADFLEFIRKCAEDIDLVVFKKMGRVTLKMYVAYINGMLVISRLGQDSQLLIERMNVPVVPARRFSLCVPKVYLDEDDFTRFVSSIRDKIILIYSRKGVVKKRHRYIAVYKNIILACLADTELPLDPDIKAKKISGLNV